MLLRVAVLPLRVAVPASGKLTANRMPKDFIVEN
jgi:hypothetical protein